jgi:hypothetical protein
MAGQGLVSTNNTCDITLKHALLSRLNLWQNSAKKPQQILSRFFGYHNVARTVVILNISVSKDYSGFGIMATRAKHFLITDLELISDKNYLTVFSNPMKI